MIFRNWRSASSMPAAVQRSAISPDDQRFTFRWVRRTISIIDSHGLVDSSVRLRLPVTPSRVSASAPTTAWRSSTTTTAVRLLVPLAPAGPTTPRRSARSRTSGQTSLSGGWPKGWEQPQGVGGARKILLLADRLANARWPARQCKAKSCERQPAVPSPRMLYYATNPTTRVCFSLLLTWVSIYFLT